MIRDIPVYILRKKGAENTICDKTEEDAEFSRLTDPVVIVDPDVKYVELLTSRLKELGFNSKVVNNGNDALRLIKKTRPLAIISETMVPGCERICNQGKHAV